MDYGQQWYDAALERFYADGGTLYPCTQQEIDFHHWSLFLRPNLGPSVSAIEATEETIWQNDERRVLSPAEKTSIFNLITAIRSGSRGYRYGPDIVIKALKDLETVFLGGRLRGNVCVQWADVYMYEKQHIANTFWDVCQSPRRRERGQVRIVLNADAIFRKELSNMVLSPLERIFNFLLHEVSQPTDSILPYKTC